jgi:hypothetical protein
LLRQAEPEVRVRGHDLGGHRGEVEAARGGRDGQRLGAGYLGELGDPNASGGAAFMIAELFAGKKKLAPIPLMMLATTTTHRPVVRPIWT